MINLKTISRRTGIFFLVAVIILELFVVCFSVPSSAASSSYSGVLDDLKKDPKFNADEYPVNNSDYSLEIISIAEGVNGELFIYVYQPCVTRELCASYINMSLKNRSEYNLEYQLYSLVFLNSDGVFTKYVVKDFKTYNNVYRYYNISAIYRPFDVAIDDSSKASDDVYGHMGYTVGYYCCAYNYNNTTVYECETVDVVPIEISAAGYLRYREGYKGYIDKTDGHFVAFSIVGYDADKICNGTIGYTYQNYTKQITNFGSDFYPEDPVTTSKFITEIEKGSTKGDGLLGVKYEWDRILSKEKFIEQLEEYKYQDVEFLKGDLETAQFVFQFLETSYTDNSTGGGVRLVNGTYVTDVGVLQLCFLVGKNIYNLGAVSNLVSDDGSPDGEIGIEENYEKLFDDFTKKILPLLGGILFILILFFFFGPVMKVVKIIFTVIKFILSLLFWVISLPFKLISWLLKPK